MHKDSARDPDGAKMQISEDFTNKWVRLKNLCLVELQNQVERETEMKSNFAGFYLLSEGNPTTPRTCF